MQNVLIRKLEAFAVLPPEDRRLLDEVVHADRAVAAHCDLIKEDEKPGDVRLIKAGLACRYKLLDDGRRQIVAFLLPGDFCDLDAAALRRMDHSVGTLAPCRIVDLPRHRLRRMLERPALAAALAFTGLVDQAVMREWLLNIGQRPADQRIGHLFCELFLRLRAVGLVTGQGYDLPLTQAELGDTVSISTVHVNRSLQSLRAAGLITLRSKRLEIVDFDRLAAYSGFNPNYLHLDTLDPE